PDAAVGMGHHVVRRIEPLAVPRIRDHGDRTVELIANDPAGQVLAGQLAALEVEGVPVAVVRWTAKDADVTVILQPAELPIIGDVAPEQVATLGAPGRALGPQDRLALDRPIPQP